MQEGRSAATNCGGDGSIRSRSSDFSIETSNGTASRVPFDLAQEERREHQPPYAHVHARIHTVAAYLFCALLGLAEFIFLRSSAHLPREYIVFESRRRTTDSYVGSRGFFPRFFERNAFFRHGSRNVGPRASDTVN